MICGAQLSAEIKGKQERKGRDKGRRAALACLCAYGTLQLGWAGRSFSFFIFFLFSIL
jgi:hypothetical protein